MEVSSLAPALAFDPGSPSDPELADRRQRGALIQYLATVAFDSVSYTHLDVYKRQALRCGAKHGRSGRKAWHQDRGRGSRGGARSAGGQHRRGS